MFGSSIWDTHPGHATEGYMVIFNVSHSGPHDGQSASKVKINARKKLGFEAQISKVGCIFENFATFKSCFKILSCAHHLKLPAT